MATPMTCSTLQKVVEVPTRHSSLVAEINPQEALQNTTEVFSCKLLLQALGKNIAACTRLLQKTKGVLNDKAPQCAKVFNSGSCFWHVGVVAAVHEVHLSLKRIL